jgi:HEAT repeat protein
VRRLTLTFVLAALLTGGRAHAFVWPDVPERVEHDLGASDPAVRALAAEKLDSLGTARATPLILGALADADANVRLAAAGAAQRARTAGATSLVLPWLGEHDVRLRIAACDVAHAVPQKDAVAPLARALSDADPVVRVSAASALGAQGDAGGVAPLLGKLDDPSPAVRTEAARALARLGDRRAVVPLIGKVEDSVPEVRQAVARALGELGDTRAAAAIVLQLRDTSPEVRVVALGALARVEGADTVDAIVPLLADKNPVVHRATLKALGALARAGSSSALQALVAQLGEGEDAAADLDASPVREALRDAGEVAVTPLRALLRAGASPTTSAGAVWVLGALRATSAGPDIIAAARRGTLPTAAALHGLAHAGSASDLPFVLELLGSENPRVRMQAVAATHALLDPVHPDGRAVEPLIAVAEAGHLAPSELVRIVDLLGRTRAPRAAAPLRGFAHHHDVAVRLAAIDALGALGPTDEGDALVSFVHDPLPEVRLHAANALSEAGGPKARDSLVQLLSNGSEVDRIAALTALAGILQRNPARSVFETLERSLDVVAFGDRDAVLVVLGRAAPLAFLQRGLLSADRDDRRTLLAASSGRPEAVPLMRQLLSDEDSSVRAEAAWALGGSGGAVAIPELERLASDPRESDAVATNAAGALARIARATRTSPAIAPLCRLLRDPRPHVRANSLTGLALAGARCGGGEDERSALLDSSPLVRAAAATAITTTVLGGEDRTALLRCASSDRSPDVADRCTRHPPPPPLGAKPREHTVLVYVEAPREEPRARTPYVIQLADGLVRAGLADRRGAFVEPLAPEGTIHLLDVVR